MNIATSTMMTALVLWLRIFGDHLVQHIFMSHGAGNLDTTNKVCMQVLEESGTLPKESKIVDLN